MQYNPTLVIMAAGMGSRFGGLKQMTPVDDQGHFIIDYSLFDAYRAGFRRVVFIIKHAIEEQFKETIGRRVEKYFEVHYVYQELDELPEGYEVPEGRVKPWGTSHAIACCRHLLNGPFTVINSDDFYGRTAYSTIYDALKVNNHADSCAMVGYKLRNTLTEFGSVARGVCTEENGYLTDVVERLKIFKNGNDAAYTEDCETFVPLSGDTIVSMNFWGFMPGFAQKLWDRFPEFLDRSVASNPLKCEYLLPFSVGEMLHEGSLRVRVLHCDEAWHGVTYQKDLPSVVEAIASMRKEGIYPEHLLDDVAAE